MSALLRGGGWFTSRDDEKVGVFFGSTGQRGVGANLIEGETVKQLGVILILIGLDALSKMAYQVGFSIDHVKALDSDLLCFVPKIFGQTKIWSV